MAFKYTEEQLNKLDKELLIQLFLGMQDQLEELTKQTQSLNDKMQLMMDIPYITIGFWVFCKRCHTSCVSLIHSSIT